MKSLVSGMKNFLKDEEGLTAVEYSIAGGLISAALVVAFAALGDQACALMDNLITAINTGSTVGLFGWTGCA